MKKTTLYLPDDLKESLERLSEAEGRSEAEILRAALRTAVKSAIPPRPRIPLVNRGLGDPRAADRVENLLNGFGRR